MQNHLWFKLRHLAKKSLPPIENGRTNFHISTGSGQWHPRRGKASTVPPRRGNDDPNEAIYETGKVKVELFIDQATSRVILKYAATSTTESRLQWVPGPPLPGGLRPPMMAYAPRAGTVGKPEYEFSRPFLYLRESPLLEDEVSIGGSGFGYNDGVLANEIILKPFPTEPGTITGTAVIQGRYPEWQLPDGTWMHAPLWFTDTGWIYQNYLGTTIRWATTGVRQEIPWSVTFERDTAGVLKEISAKLAVKELTPGVDRTIGQVATPLRIVNSSNGPGMVHKVGYPSYANLKPRKDFDNNPANGAQDNPGVAGDQRAEPETAITDWIVEVEARTKW